MNTARASAERAASVVRNSVPQMLSDVGQAVGLLPATAMAEAIIRATANWITMFVGPRTAYQILQEIADETALRIIDRARTKQ